jgi:predicted MFS family arabinose efflux permease
MSAPGRVATDWRTVGLLIGAGLLAACQVGKAAVAVPDLRRDLGLSLGEASWVVGTYGALGAVGGVFFGAVVGRLGGVPAVVAGLLLIAAGSLGGSLATALPALLATRVAEGCGFLAVVIAAPAMLAHVTAARDRNLSFALWSAYMPVGTAAMMLAGPALLESGWRWLWVVNGALALACAALVFATLPRLQPHAPTPPRSGLLTSMARVITAPGPLLLALAFGTYTLQYFALTALLPTLLVDRLGLSLAAAGTVSACVVLANAFGNIAAGGIMRLGVPLWATAAVGFASIGLLSLAVFSSLPATWIALFAAASLAVSGAIPASIFAGVPRLAPAAHLAPMTLGLITQASNLGQLLGPAALAAWIERSDWSRSPLFFALVAIAGLCIAAALRVRLVRS